MMNLSRTVRMVVGSALVAAGVLGGCASTETDFRTRPTEVTVRCPVTDTDTEKRDAETAEYGGKVYYFCCAGCKEAFERDPDRYASP